MWLLDHFLRGFIQPALRPLQITTSDGLTYRYRDGMGQPLHLRFTDSRASGHIVRYPPLGAGES